MSERGDASRLPAHRRARIRIIMDALERSEVLAALARPTFRLHRLKGNRKRQWAVTVSRHWRIVFRFEHGDAWDVDLVDYH